MFRWSLSLTPLSVGSDGAARDAALDVTPRGAAFTLAALTHIGHAAHLAVIDAYLKGQFRPTATTGLGEDSRLVLTALAAPLVAAYELGIGWLTLADLILLPPSLAPETNGLGRTRDSVRFLLRGPNGWRCVRASERFEEAGCLGTPQPGLGSAWDDVIVQAPLRPSVHAVASDASESPPADVELRIATVAPGLSESLVAALRTLGLARFARAGGRVRAAATEAARQVEAMSSEVESVREEPLAAGDLMAEARSWATVPMAPPAPDPDALAAALAEPLTARRPVESALAFQSVVLDVSLTPDLDGYQTLCLLPPPGVSAAAAFELMRAAAWATIEALIGRPLAEYRTEVIVLRLSAADGRSTMLEIGASVVIVRNQTVFTGWVGSDGRVMLKLFPPGGMVALSGSG